MKVGIDNHLSHRFDMGYVWLQFFIFVHQYCHSPRENQSVAIGKYNKNNKLNSGTLNAYYKRGEIFN